MEHINEIESAGTQTSAKSYRITVNKAVELVKSFVDNFKYVAEKEGFGGTIKAGDFPQKFLRPPYYDGIMAWFCYNESDTDYGKLFLAFDEDEMYTPGVEYQRPSESELICPTKESVFTYDSGEPIDQLIQTHEISPEKNGSRVIKREKVIPFKDRFKEIFGRVSKYPYGFFENENNNDLRDLLRYKPIKVEYVRYYFGYDENKESNKFRIVLIGVDKQGRNMVPSTSDGRPEGGPYILQKSWPPHPKP